MLRHEVLPEQHRALRALPGAEGLLSVQAARGDRLGVALLSAWDGRPDLRSRCDPDPPVPELLPTVHAQLLRRSELSCRRDLCRRDVREFVSLEVRR